MKKDYLTLETQKEYCCTNGHIRYAGVHLIVELWNASNLDNLQIIDQTFRQAIDTIGATLLKIDLHKFSPSGGVSGMAIISESHLSIHSWPEYRYAAIDIFVCGDVDPYKALPVIKQGFETDSVQITEIKRGVF